MATEQRTAAYYWDPEKEQGTVVGSRIQVDVWAGDTRDRAGQLLVGTDTAVLRFPDVPAAPAKTTLEQAVTAARDRILAAHPQPTPDATSTFIRDDLLAVWNG